MTRAARVLGLLGTLAATGGCTAIDDFDQFHIDAPPTYRLAPGVGFPDVRTGYSLTGATGGSFRVVWHGTGAETYSGTLETTGTFSFTRGCLGACPLAAGDTLSVEKTGAGQRLTFQGKVAEELGPYAGFDVTSTAEPVRFDLLIDGARRPAEVYYPSADQGRQVVSAGAVPFLLTTR